MKTRVLKFVSLVLLFASVISCSKNKQVVKAAVTSTSWTAAFADIAGYDTVQAIAPASLRHPPEYELTVSDIQTIKNSSVFIYAGFERMMKTIGETIKPEDVNMVQIACNNSIETVTAMTKKLAELNGSQKENEKRLKEYTDTILNAKSQFEKDGLAGAQVYCNVNQIYLAKDLGFEVKDTFGPGPVTAGQIAAAKNGGYAFIIDNVHNPVGGPLSEVSDAPYIIWRNFPEAVEHNALKKVVEQNIQALKDKLSL